MEIRGFCQTVTMLLLTEVRATQPSPYHRKHTAGGKSTAKHHQSSEEKYRALWEEVSGDESTLTREEMDARGRKELPSVTAVRCALSLSHQDLRMILKKLSLLIPEGFF